MEIDMGLLDNLGGMISGLVSAATQGNSASILNEGLSKTGLGDVDGLVQKLQQSGLGAQVQSWMGSGNNLPISPEQIQAALGNEHVRQLAEHFGIPVDAALNLLAQHIPNAVAQSAGDSTQST
jgi:uncharacterized protein YidB (DUF937 family)